MAAVPPPHPGRRMLGRYLRSDGAIGEGNLMKTILIAAILLTGCAAPQVAHVPDPAFKQWLEQAKEKYEREATPQRRARDAALWQKWTEEDIAKIEQSGRDLAVDQRMDTMKQQFDQQLNDLKTQQDYDHLRILDNED